MEDYDSLDGKEFKLVDYVGIVNTYKEFGNIRLPNLVGVCKG